MRELISISWILNRSPARRPAHQPRLAIIVPASPGTVNGILSIVDNPANGRSNGPMKTLSGPLASALLDFRASDPSVWLGALRSAGQWLSNLAAVTFCHSTPM